MITYADVRAALVRATAHQPGAHADVYMIARELERMGHADRDPMTSGLPQEVYSTIAAELGALHDNGEATTAGWGMNRTARYDGVVVIMPDGRAYPLVDVDRRAVVITDPIEFATKLAGFYPDVRPGPITDEGSSTE